MSTNEKSTMKNEKTTEPMPTDGKSGAVPRRDFLQKAALAYLGLQFLSPVSVVVAQDSKTKTKELPPSLDNRNHLERMRADLLESLKKPIAQRRWVMVIDLQKCIGCKACTVSCNAENNLPPGVVYRPVMEKEIGRFPDVRKVFLPRPCLHCENPPCVPVCPVTATWKREDGIVVIDYDICIGCRNCIAACPYNARTSDFGEFYGDETPAVMDYETRPNYEYSKEWKRVPHQEKSPMGNARKCHFCLHRIREGILPACVTTCLGGATYFGDLNNRHSLVHELAGSGRVMRLKEYLNTKPAVFYLV